MNVETKEWERETVPANREFCRLYSGEDDRLKEAMRVLSNVKTAFKAEAEMRIKKQFPRRSKWEITEAGIFVGPDEMVDWVQDKLIPDLTVKFRLHSRYDAVTEAQNAIVDKLIELAPAVELSPDSEIILDPVLLEYQDDKTAMAILCTWCEVIRSYPGLLAEMGRTGGKLSGTSLLLRANVRDWKFDAIRKRITVEEFMKLCYDNHGVQLVPTNARRFKIPPLCKT